MARINKKGVYPIDKRKYTRDFKLQVLRDYVLKFDCQTVKTAKEYGITKDHVYQWSKTQYGKAIVETLKKQQEDVVINDRAAEVLSKSGAMLPSIRHIEIEFSMYNKIKELVEKIVEKAIVLVEKVENVEDMDSLAKMLRECHTISFKLEEINNRNRNNDTDNEFGLKKDPWYQSILILIKQGQQRLENIEEADIVDEDNL